MAKTVVTTRLVCNYFWCCYIVVVSTPEAAAPRLGLRERKKQQTRELIAEAARRLFTERGFERVTVAEIARAAEVSEQTVFNYFPTKEDLVFWRLGTFEEELLRTIRERAGDESALAGFGRFLLAQRGLLGQVDPEAQERLAAVARMISESPALLAREQQIFARYTGSLADLLAAEQQVAPGDLRPRIAAHAMMGVHQALVAYTRQRVLEGARSPELADDVRAEAERALALLEHGLGDYATTRARA
jgi:AcrR family transcriptional regulator